MKSIEDLKEEVRGGVTADDVVQAVLYKSARLRIPKSRAFLQRAFFCLRREEPALFRAFVFDESGVTPFSEELDAALFRLEASGLLSALNPNGRETMPPGEPERLRPSYDKLIARFPGLPRCAALFAEWAQREGEE